MVKFDCRQQLWYIEPKRTHFMTRISSQKTHQQKCFSPLFGILLCSFIFVFLFGCLSFIFSHSSESMISMTSSTHATMATSSENHDGDHMNTVLALPQKINDTAILFLGMLLGVLLVCSRGWASVKNGCEWLRSYIQKYNSTSFWNVFIFLFLRGILNTKTY